MLIGTYQKSKVNHIGSFFLSKFAICINLSLEFIKNLNSKLIIIISFVIMVKEDYKIVKKILDHLGIYEFKRKRPPPKIESSPDEFNDYISDDYIDCDHVC